MSELLGQQLHVSSDNVRILTKATQPKLFNPAFSPGVFGLQDDSYLHGSCHNPVLLLSTSPEQYTTVILSQNNVLPECIYGGPYVNNYCLTCWYIKSMYENEAQEKHAALSLRDVMQ